MKDEYKNAAKSEKSCIAKRILGLVRERGGRFLDVVKGGGYAECEDRVRPLEKCKRALRDDNEPRAKKFAEARAREDEQVEMARQATADPLSFGPGELQGKISDTRVTRRARSAWHEGAEEKTGGKEGKNAAGALKDDRDGEEGKNAAVLNPPVAEGVPEVTPPRASTGEDVVDAGRGPRATTDPLPRGASPPSAVGKVRARSSSNPAAWHGAELLPPLGIQKMHDAFSASPDALAGSPQAFHLPFERIVLPADIQDTLYRFSDVNQIREVANEGSSEESSDSSGSDDDDSGDDEDSRSAEELDDFVFGLEIVDDYFGDSPQ
jgi:hypothetical protein